MGSIKGVVCVGWCSIKCDIFIYFGRPLMFERSTKLEATDHLRDLRGMTDYKWKPLSLTKLVQQHWWCSRPLKGVHVRITSPLKGVHFRMTRPLKGVHVRMTRPLKGVHFRMSWTWKGVPFRMTSPLKGVHFRITRSLKGIHFRMTSPLEESLLEWQCH